MPADVSQRLSAQLESEKTRIVDEVANRGKEYFESEMEKLENWADDLKENLEQELKSLDKDIRALKREARQASDLDEKIELHKKAKEMERKRNEKRRNLFEAQDEVDGPKEQLISEVEARLKQKVEVNEVFALRWRVV